MFKNVLLLLVLLVSGLGAAAQSLSDTLRLREVVVYGIPEEKYAVGSKVETLDSLYLASQQSRSLSEVLGRRSPIYFKEYGPGQLSTISFRGTGAGQTALLWNGLNLNQPNLGQTDFSLVPLFAIENISLQYGGCSALYGSDAMGGTIYLQNTPQWSRPLYIKAQQEAGSFGHRFTGLAAGAGPGKWFFSTKIYRQQADNGFEYTNTLKKSRPVERNRNSRFEQHGLVQDIGYRFSSRSLLNFNSWYRQSYRQIQPAMGDLNSADWQEDRNLNLSLQYKYRNAWGLLDMQLGHLYNYLLYNGGNEYQTWQNIGRIRYEKEVAEGLQLQAGAKINLIEAAIEQYRNGSAHENRGDLFTSLRYKLSKRLNTSLNLRQALVEGYQVPFTPSAGLSLDLIQGQRSRLQLLASGGRSYRVPTLNDRYWLPGGNPDLLPEDSWNLESTLKYLLNQKSRSLELSATAYRMWTHNLIMWLPGTVRGSDGKPVSAWTPRNFQEVAGKGLEGSLHFSQKRMAGTLETGGTLAYTRSLNKKARNEYDRTLNRQLPFVPVFKSNAYLSYQLKGWSAGLNWAYTGIRYTTGEEEEAFSVPAYQLIDCSFSKSFSLNKHLLQLALEARNLLNEQYQNYEKRAMPGRNFNITAQYIFNQSL